MRTMGKEISQGKRKIAGHLGLNNFIMFFDSNDIQSSTPTNEVPTEDTAMKYKAWGWNVLTIDGYNHNETGKKTLKIGKTIMGKGSVDANGSMFEGHRELHGQPISHTGADYAKTLLNLGANPESPFDIYDDVRTFCNNLLKKKIAQAAEKGGYLVKKSKKPDITLVANGSEVSTLLEAATLLEASGNIQVNVASIISEGLFRSQSREYQVSILPLHLPCFGFTAGLPVNLEGLVGGNGKVFGLEHFGYSAPASVLDEKFGFTVEHIFKEVLDSLKTSNES